MKFDLSNLDRYQRITTLDGHTEGEPLRIITSGYPPIPGNCMLEKRNFVADNLDDLRRALMFEPRGHADMYGALITDAVTSDGDFGILFMHNEGYSSMCGHAILATVTAMHECGELVLDEGQTKIVKIDSPAGRIQAYASMQQRRLHVSFDCVPSFVEATDVSVNVPGLGQIACDIAFGGAYYAYVDADTIDLACAPSNAERLIALGREIKQAVMESYTIRHPEHADLGFLYGTIFTSSKVTDPDSHSRHVCIFADGELDRSPTGTGVSGRIALLHQKNRISTNDSIKIESIISSSMRVSITETLKYGNKDAVIPRVSGRAFISGKHEFLLDPDDPFKDGFLVR